jgi:hypothetical protein
MSDIGGIGILVALGYLFAIFLGIIKNAIEGSNQKNSQNKSTDKSKEESHIEYPEEPDYPDPEDADLTEFEL